MSNAWTVTKQKETCAHVLIPLIGIPLHAFHCICMLHLDCCFCFKIALHLKKCDTSFFCVNILRHSLAYQSVAHLNVKRAHLRGPARSIVISTTSSSDGESEPAPSRKRALSHAPTVTPLSATSARADTSVHMVTVPDPRPDLPSPPVPWPTHRSCPPVTSTLASWGWTQPCCLVCKTSQPPLLQVTRGICLLRLTGLPNSKSGPVRGIPRMFGGNDFIRWPR